jgi:hypothetical protein
MSGAIPPLLQYVFMAWCLVKHRDNTNINVENRNTHNGQNRWKKKLNRIKLHLVDTSSVEFRLIYFSSLRYLFTSSRLLRRYMFNYAILITGLGAEVVQKIIYAFPFNFGTYIHNIRNTFSQQEGTLQCYRTTRLFL